MLPIPLKNKIKKALGYDVPSMYRIINGRKVIFVHIPKAAGTSVAAALGFDVLDRDIIKERYTPEGTHYRDPIPPGDYAVHYMLRDYAEQLGQEVVEDAFTFGIVRNPWSRLYSMFKFKQKVNQHRMGELPIDFNQWVRWTIGEIRHPYYAQPREFYLPQFQWLSLDGHSIDVDFVGALETLDSDWQVICDRIGKEMPLKRLNTTSKSHAAEYRNAYDDESAELVARVYRQDIEEWGYEF